MTVSALNTRNDITATSGQATFTYTFMVLAATDMTVYQNGALLASGYTVTGVGSTTGGTVVLDVGALTGQIVSLVLAMPLDRTTDYQNSGDFLASDVNADFDKIYIGGIQNENWIDRGLRLQEVEPPTAGVDMTIPLKDARKGKYLAFNAATGGPEVVSGVGTSTDASLVTYLPAGAGAVLTTVQDKLRQIVSAEDFGAVGDGSDDSLAIKAAIDSLPASGGIVTFGVGTFRSPYTSTALIKDNITFQGSGMPTFNAGYTALTGGTIFQGTLLYQGSGTRFFDLGVDVGSDVCTALFSGVAQEGLVTGTPATYQYDNRLRNISVIAQNSGAPIHAVLYEHQDGGSLENIDTVYGASGIVLKAKNININGIRSRSSSNYTFLIKADNAGGICDNINATNLILDTVADPSGMIPGAGANWDSNGLILLSTTGYNVTGVNITNVITKNTKSGIRYNTVSGGTIEGNITQVKSYNHFFACVDLDSGSQNSKISGNFELMNYGVLNAGTNNTFDNITVKNSNHNSFSNGGVGCVFSNCTADAPDGSYAGFDNSANDSIVRLPKFLNMTTAVKYQNTSGTQTIEDITVLNTLTASISDYLLRQLVSSIEAISGTDSIVAAWFGTNDSSSTTQIDYSNNGTHTGTFRDASLVAQQPLVPAAQGMGNIMTYDGGHLCDTPDAADLSFGNGSTDSPFSIISLNNPYSTNNGSILAKSDFTTGSTQSEWDFLWASSSGLYLSLYDDSTGGSIARRYSVSLGPDVGVWNLYAGTYDGGSLAAGIKVYKEGVDVTNSDVSSGSYTAMENTTAKAGNYTINAAGALQSQLTQKVGCTILFDVELSSANIVAINALITSYFSL